MMIAFLLYDDHDESFQRNGKNVFKIFPNLMREKGIFPGVKSGILKQVIKLKKKEVF